MHGVVKKWGNSAAIRIPAAILKAANVRLDQPVDVREEAGRIVIDGATRKGRVTPAELAEVRAKLVALIG